MNRFDQPKSCDWPLKSDVHWGSPGDTTIFQPSTPVAELIRACAESENAAAWQAFVSYFQRHITLSILRIVRRWGLSPDIIDDLVQETYLKLCADRCQRLHRFATEYPQAIEGYIKTIAINVAQDYIRAQRAQRRGGGEVSQLPEHLEPRAESAKSGGEQAIEQTVLMSEINRYLELCTDGDSRNRDRIIFWLHYQQGMTANAIAVLPSVGLTVKGVESALLRMTRQVRNGIQQVENQQTQKKASLPEGFGQAPSY